MKKIMVLMVLCLMSAQQIPLNGMKVYQKLNDENKNENKNQSEKISLYYEVKNGEKNLNEENLLQIVQQKLLEEKIEEEKRVLEEKKRKDEEITLLNQQKELKKTQNKYLKYVKTAVVENAKKNNKTLKITDDDVKEIVFTEHYRMGGKHLLHNITLEKAFREEEVDESSLIYACNQVEQDFEIREKSRARNVFLGDLCEKAFACLALITCPCWCPLALFVAAGAR